MPNIQAVSSQRFSSHYWLRYTNYAFTAGDAIALLNAHELSKAALAMPVAFVRTNDGFVLVALQGIQGGTNLFVDSQGNWLGTYVPHSYMCYPFLLAKNEQGEQVLCINEDSNMITDEEGPTSMPFFNEDNTPTDKMNEILEFLGRNRANFEQTVQMCALLDKHGLIKPWEIKIQAESEETVIDDLYCINEEKLANLSGEALLELNESNALMLVFGQLFSMKNLNVLANLGQIRIGAMQGAAKQSAELDFDLVDDGGSLNFDNF